MKKALNLHLKNMSILNKVLILLTITAGFFAFKATMQDHLIGNWVVENYSNGKFQYLNKNSLDINKGGVSFKPNGKLIYRQNAGWCGTLPITYKNFPGEYVFNQSDSTIFLNYGFWGGKIEAIWKIEEISSNTLQATIIESNAIRNE